MPTRTPLTGSLFLTPDDGPTATTMPATPEAAVIPTLAADQALMMSRIGLAGGLENVTAAAQLGLRSRHFTFWRVWPELPNIPDLTTWQTVRLGQVGEEAQWPAVSEVIAATIEAHPGSFWLIGNEPDVPWQDNTTAEDYAVAYHDIYQFIKSRDPSARIGAGGISLPTPLRLAYLDRVLETYRARYGQPMPVDLWSIHLFTLREEAGSWGIGIPPGMTEAAGELYEIEDHGDIELLKTHVNRFRDWMADNGYGDKPLAVTEFGILLPEDYGFPPELVQRYLTEAFDYFLTATGDSGLAADGGRLVQYAFWYSLYDDGDYQTGNLYDGATDSLTELGQAYIEYVGGLTAADSAGQP